jgi:hypothetical protein
MYNSLNIQNLDQLYKKRLLLLIFQYKHLLMPSNHDYSTRYHININLTKYTCNSNFGKMNPLLEFICVSNTALMY